MDALYEDIGAKIKSVAKWVFGVEAAMAILTGLIMIFASENGNGLLAGLGTMIVGPAVALVSSYFLYAVGEAVERICANEEHTRELLEIAKADRKVQTNPKQPAVKSAPVATPRQYTDALKVAADTAKKSATKRCPYCGDIVRLGRCELCGKEVK